MHPGPPQVFYNEQTLYAESGSYSELDGQSTSKDNNIGYMLDVAVTYVANHYSNLMVTIVVITC